MLGDELVEAIAEEFSVGSPGWKAAMALCVRAYGEGYADATANEALEE